MTYGGITSSRKNSFLIIKFVIDHPDCTIPEIIKALDLSQSTVYPIIAMAVAVELLVEKKISSNVHIGRPLNSYSINNTTISWTKEKDTVEQLNNCFDIKPIASIEQTPTGLIHRLLDQ